MGYESVQHNYLDFTNQIVIWVFKSYWLLLCDIRVLENKLFYNYENEWLEKVDRLPKLRLYRNIKRYFRTKNYLWMNIPNFQRSPLAQLRCGILPIRIETGRYRGEPNLYYVFSGLYRRVIPLFAALHCLFNFFY